MFIVRGADQKEYGPVSVDQIRQWIAERRLIGSSEIRRADVTEWQTIAALPDFAEALGAARTADAGMPVAPATVMPRTSGMAITGMIFGVLAMTVGLICCAPLFSVPGLMFSAIALSQINRNPQVQLGKGLAVAGLVLSTLALLISLGLGLFGGALDFLREMKF